MSDTSLLPPSATAVERDIAIVTSRISDVPVPIQSLWDPDNCPVELLPWLAWAWRVPFWRTSLDEDTKRSLIKEAPEWRMHRGTLWAVMHLLELLGFEDVEIIEHWQTREDFLAAGGLQLDGTWQRDGSQQLESFRSLTGLPYLANWATFCVRLNLTEARWPGWEEDLRYAVNKAKPVRSWPVWVYYIYIELDGSASVKGSIRTLLDISLHYPWPTRQLDGTWQLDGSVSIEQLNISCKLILRLQADRPKDYHLIRLGLSGLKVNGDWKVGRNPIFATGDFRKVA